MFQRIVVGRALTASIAAAIVLVGGVATAATEPVETGEVGGAMVAVGLPPVPPTTADVAVGLPPVPPTTADVAVGLPPVPPTTADVAVGLPPVPLTTAAPPRTPAPVVTAPPTTTVRLDPAVVADQVTSLVVVAATQAALAIRR